VSRLGVNYVVYSTSYDSVIKCQYSPLFQNGYHIYVKGLEGNNVLFAVCGINSLISGRFHRYVYYMIHISDIVRMHSYDSDYNWGRLISEAQARRSLPALCSYISLLLCRLPWANNKTA
jgi:hypothetical protein